ncbi:MAG: acyltransferase [Sphingomonas sp.]|uniref:acyltransferase family protein n=1 Tax=Sphingomonas sp. TaxID=28214 RepID=UPI001AC3CFA4|nr:acyltransferase [Sphingomonas sp.]MBN8808472.1 acyltransferase [Sphingomonas sp.]
MRRHYGMDWLRIGAFALLILYHAAMVFTPWGFHVKTERPIEWMSVAMLITNPWRLTLLFLVSGYASRALLAKSDGVGAFLSSRTARLLIPLAFGIAVMVPPQSWVELVTQHAYPHGFGYFLLHDYFAFDDAVGIGLPTWNHLWFVAYLFTYTAALALLLVLPWPARTQHWFDRAFGGWRALVLPTLYLILSQVVIFHRWADTQDLIHDGTAHLAFFPAFLFGFALARSPSVMAGFVRWWPVAAVLAAGSYAVGAGIELAYPDGGPFPPPWIADQMLVAHQIQSWTTVAALVGIAERYLNRDAPFRSMLTEAVFPFYLIHQTIIVLVEYWVRPLGIGAAGEFSVLVIATVAGCWAFYRIGREIGWLRPLIGLRRLGPEPRASGHDRPQELDARDPWRRRRNRPQPDLA